MLGLAALAITCLSAIRFILDAFYGYVKLCSHLGQRVKGSSFTRPSTDHAEPLILLGVGGETNLISVTWEGELWVGKELL